MKKNIIVLLLLSLGIFSSLANDTIEITLLTCSSGKETFSAWGHTAIRVIDKEAKIDVVYNFGLFDFGTPNFYGKFIKGRLLYKLGVHDTYSFYRSYEREKRQIIEQKLNITEQEKIKIINELVRLYKPENRYYLYRFAGKNCTSEVRDLILRNVNSSYKIHETDKTVRKQLNEFLQGRKWLQFSMSLIMGYKIDRKIDSYQSLFLPDYLCRSLREIKVNGNESIIEKETIFNPVTDPYKSHYPTWANPIFTFLLLLVIALLFKSKAIQNTILVITGLTGLLVLIVSLFTEHPELQYNLNILWMNPLYILLAFKFKNKPNFKRYLTYLTQFLILAMIPIWIFKVQYFEISYLLIVSAISIFNLRILFPEKKLHLIS